MDGRRLDGYPISSPCEPNGSGELKIISGQTCRLVTYIFQFTKYFARIFIGQNIFFPDLSYTVSQYFMTLALMAVRQEVNNFESSVVVH